MKDESIVSVLNILKYSFLEISGFNEVTLFELNSLIMKIMETI